MGKLADDDDEFAPAGLSEEMLKLLTMCHPEIFALPRLAETDRVTKRDENVEPRRKVSGQSEEN